MMRLPVLLSLLLLVSATVGQAQDDGNDSPLEYRFSIGMTGGFSQTFQQNASSPGDPINLDGSATVYHSFAVMCRYRITPQLALEFAVNSYLHSNEAAISDNQSALFEAEYPGHFAISDHFSKPGLTAIGGGISYALLFGDFSIEPSLLACYTGTDPGRSYILLKKQGENQYRDINHQTTQAGTFALIPAVLLRYDFRSEDLGMGVMFRASHFHTRLAIEHSITETTLAGEQRVEQMTVQHTFSMLNFELGVYYNLF